MLLLLVLAAVAGVSAWLHDTAPYRAMLVALDATALLAVFCTGRPRRAAARPRDGSRRASSAPWPGGSAPACPHQETRGSWAASVCRLAAIAPTSSGSAVAPRTAPRASARSRVWVWSHVPGAGGAVGIPEVMLRVTTGSPCESALAPLLLHGRTVRGRRPDERVECVFSPRLPTARMTAALVVALVRALTSAGSVRAAKLASGETRRAA